MNTQQDLLLKGGEMPEIKAVMDDYRMQALGGMMGALDLWNLAVIPSLLNNLDWNHQQAGGLVGISAGKVHQVNHGGPHVHPRGGTQG